MFVKQDPPTGEWANWRNWPHINIAWDQGGDDVSCSNYFDFIQLSCTSWWDFQHGGKNDFKGMLRDTDKYNFWLLWMVHMNTAAGPALDQTRWLDLNASWETLFDNLTPNSCPLFTEDFDALLAEMGGVGALPGERSVAHELWALLKEDVPVDEPRRVNLQRFWDSTKRSRAALERWHRDLLNRQFKALEDGSLTSRLAVKLVIKSTPDGEARTTESRKLSDAERMIRNTGLSPVLVSVALLSQASHKSYVNQVLEAVEPSETWCCKASARLRSVIEAEKWLVEQMDGGCMQHIKDTLAKPGQMDALERCGIRRPGELVAVEQDSLNDVILHEDEACESFGCMCMSIGSRRLQRLHWFFSWPCRFAGMLGTDELKQKTVDAFAADTLSWQAFANAVPRTSEMQTVVDRSIFRKPAVVVYEEVISCLFWNSYRIPLANPGLSLRIA